jgi:hypothetical protein
MGIINNQGVFIAPPLGEGEGTSLTSFREDDDFSTELFDESIVLADLPNDIGIAFIKSSDSPADYATIALNGDNTSAIYVNNTNDEVKGIISGDVYIGYKKGTTTPVANIKGSQPIGNLYVNGTTCLNGSLTVDGGILAEGVLCATISACQAITTPLKCFNIPHPLKENKRLVYSCLEGPEVGVYVRGRLTNSNIIELPDYWSKLVDPESITVYLTQIGYSQDLIVEKIEWGRQIIIKSGNASNIDCYYTVNATRNDLPPLEVEQDP